MNNDITKLGMILGVWAHPDDEAWSMAGLMIRVCQNNQRVHLVTATRGEAGNIDGCEDCDRSELAKLREKEMNDSLSCIGGVTHEWLDYEDGKMKDADDQEAIDSLVKILDKIMPDTVVTFEPNGITGHDDHKTISTWTRKALQLSRCSAKLLMAVETRDRYEEFGRELDEKFNIYFNVDRPHTIDDAELALKIILDSKELTQKIACLKAHKSQTSHMFSDSEMLRHVNELLGVEAFIAADY